MWNFSEMTLLVSFPIIGARQLARQLYKGKILTTAELLCGVRCVHGPVEHGCYSVEAT
jgi:hypothetical protein